MSFQVDCVNKKKEFVFNTNFLNPYFPIHFTSDSRLRSSLPHTREFY